MAAVISEIADQHILNCLEYAHVLAYATESDSPAVHFTVFDQNVCRVGFGRDSIVTIYNFPAPENDIIHEICVGAISVPGGLFRQRSAVNVDVLKNYSG
jgi:hypothetical protein